MKKFAFIPIAFMIFLSKMMPFTWIVGSHHVIFSWTSMMAPAIANQFGFAWLSLFFVSYKLLSTASILLFFVHRTPLLFSAYAYKNHHWLTSLLLPAVCMGLFVMHDVGLVAWTYSLYWLIPMALYFVKNSMISRALSASFIAHAVGSVIWLYTTNIAAPVWIALIPVVFCERLLIATGIVGLDLFIARVRAGNSWRYFLHKAGQA